MLKPGTQKAADAELAARFTEWYCKSHHKNICKAPLESDGSHAGIYLKKIPVLCEDCADYVRYAEERTENCLKNPKPFCSRCDIKCYNSKMKEYSLRVMRYSGPRSVFSRYCLKALHYVIQTLNAKKN